MSSFEVHASKSSLIYITQRGKKPNTILSWTLGSNSSCSLGKLTRKFLLLPGFVYRALENAVLQSQTVTCGVFWRVQALWISAIKPDLSYLRCQVWPLHLKRKKSNPLSPCWSSNFYALWGGSQGRQNTFVHQTEFPFFLRINKSVFERKKTFPTVLLQ